MIFFLIARRCFEQDLVVVVVVVVVACL